MVPSGGRRQMPTIWVLPSDGAEVPAEIDELTEHHDGPVVIFQGLTVLNVTKDAVVARQATIDPTAWPVVGQSQETGPPMSTPLAPPARRADPLITD